MQNNRVICSRAGPVQDIASTFGVSSVPMQDNRQHIWRPDLGPYKIIGNVFCGQCRAHTMPSVEYFGPVRGLCKSTGSTYGTRMGPYKTISSRVWGQCWAHTR